MAANRWEEDSQFLRYNKLTKEEIQGLCCLLKERNDDGKFVLLFKDWTANETLYFILFRDIKNSLEEKYDELIRLIVSEKMNESIEQKYQSWTANQIAEIKLNQAIEGMKKLIAVQEKKGTIIPEYVRENIVLWKNVREICLKEIHNENSAEVAKLKENFLYEVEECSMTPEEKMYQDTKARYPVPDFSMRLVLETLKKVAESSWQEDLCEKTE